MSPEKISVIIPAYNQADFLGDAIRSVLDQTYQDFELIIVNDASPDHTSEVVKQFSDPRIIYLVHERNKMLPATRNTGIRASTGGIIALLDADDIYHPQKLEKHITYLEANPNIDVTYNARFELNYSSTTIRGLARPPLHVNLEDLVLGFPFAPSDMVVRRERFFEVGLFDETFTDYSEDLDLNCQLALAGCKFGSVDKALNYRRHHSGRVIKNVAGRLEAALRSLKKTFCDIRCPKSALALKDTAFMNHYLVWSCVAFSQNETSLGQRYLLESLHLDPSIIHDRSRSLMQFLLNFCIADENIDHAVHLQHILEQLPSAFKQAAQHYEWAVGRGFLLKAIRAITWGRIEDGHAYFAEASKMKVKIDDEIVGRLTYQLLCYENEFGPQAVDKVVKELTPYLGELGGHQVLRRLWGSYSFNLAFQNYRTRNYKGVRSDVLNAFISQPKYLGNRGIWSILFRSLYYRIKELGFTQG